MNLFFLDVNLSNNAVAMCDKHIVKMILETAQMLYFCWHVRSVCPDSNLPPYRMAQGHKNHPMSIWIRKCKANYDYACYYGILLCAEYTSRYGKYHATEKHFAQLFLWGYPPLTKVIEPPKKAKKITFAYEDIPYGLNSIPLCFDSEYYVYKDGPGSPVLGVESYRNYYASKQSQFKMVWKQNKPEWFTLK